MERLSPLANFVVTKKLTWLDKILCCYQAAASISDLHRLQLAHLDVKLDNFLLDETTNLIKLADYGFAREVQPGELVGKVGTWVSHVLVDTHILCYFAYHSLVLWVP